MEKYKILNLYACLGGNRYKWDKVAKKANVNMKVTAVEWDEELSKLYQERFPNDTVIVADAHQYLLDHYKEFDFIWSSPPCPTHSSIQFSFKNVDARKKQYPDMKLYQEIIFLDNFFTGKYCVENVISYYNPLIPPKKRDRHYYWTNFNLPNTLGERKAPTMNSKNGNELHQWIKFYNYDFNKYKGKQDKRKVARNLVDYEAGKTILQTALNCYKARNTNQLGMFN